VLRIAASFSLQAAAFPIVGRVCMNMTFVDVTDVPQAIPHAK